MTYIIVNEYIRLTHIEDLVLDIGLTSGRTGSSMPTTQRQVRSETMLASSSQSGSFDMTTSFG